MTASLLKTRKDRVLAAVLGVLVVLAVLSIVSVVRTQHSAEIFVKKYQNIDQTKHRTK